MNRTRTHPRIRAVAVAARWRSPAAAATAPAALTAARATAAPPKRAADTAAAGAENGVAVLTVASVPEVGPILVDADGFTVYDFHKDKGTTSSCYGACARSGHRC